ncbi:MAG: DUF799 family lipoprotein [Deltaproteobacteria bacterium]|nr:DUF799 family lipoprotein [Deltaproteobacteria bacterium]
MVTCRKVILVSLPLILCLFCASCVVSTSQTGTMVVQKTEVLLSGEYQTTEAYEKRKPKTVAVLPFLNETGKEEAPEVVRRCFYNHFSSLPYLDMELFRVDSLLRSKGVTDPTNVQKMTPQQLGAILNVDAVIYGTITHYNRIYAVLVSDVAVGAILRMADTKTGEDLWTGKHVAHTPSGGIATTPVGLILTALSTAYNLRAINLYRTSDDLFREMVKAVPKPTLAEAEAPPNIIMLAQDGAFSIKKAGDVIKVAMEGDAGMRATFDIGDFKKGLFMKEVSPGNYVGEYRIVPGDNVKDALVTGHLLNEAGVAAEWIDALGNVNIDTTPPKPPAQLTESSRDKAVYLSWEPNSERDLAKYRVYRSDTPLTGYQLHKELENTDFLDSDLTNFKQLHYKLTAVDAAGNESETSSMVQGMGVPKGPTPVRGELKENTSWYAAASPYIIETPVIVPDKMRLVIEAGTTVVSKGAGIRIYGGLTAKGSEKRIIAFTTDVPLAWDGLLFENKGASEFEFCSVQGAKIGALIRSGSLAVRDSEFTGCTVALKVEGTHSKPVIERNKIINNIGNAVEVSSGAEPVLNGNQISNNGGKALDVVAASPKLSKNEIIHNKGGGLFFLKAGPIIQENVVHDNGSVDLLNHPGSQTIEAERNFWGSKSGEKIIGRISGRVNFSPVLDAAPPDGKPLKLSIMESNLQGNITQDSYLILSKSPYSVTGEAVVDGGAVLYIEPGVVLKYMARESVIEVKDGGVHARGRADAPILFVSGSSSPGPGDYAAAVRFQEIKKKGQGVGERIADKVKSILGDQEESFFAYCVFAHADTPLDVYYGRPDITYSFIGFNRQSGIICRNDSRPNIVSNTLYNNLGTAAIECYGMTNPRIKNNNILENPFAVQSFSTITLDARSNWWGAAPPNANLFLGNLEYQPYLTEPNPEAFNYSFK